MGSYLRDVTPETAVLDVSTSQVSKCKRDPENNNIWANSLSHGKYILQEWGGGSFIYFPL